MAEKAVVKVRKKKWIQIIAPAMFNRQILGETCVYEPEQAVGRNVTINLTNLTGDIRKQNTSVTFAINQLSEGKLYADSIGYEVAPTAIRRMVRRRIDKITMSFNAKTADNKFVVIKPVMVTRDATKHSILSKIRNMAQESLKEYIGKSKFEEILEDIISRKLQITFQKQLSKIFPIRALEISILKIAKEKKKEGLKEEEKPETVMPKEEAPVKEGSEEEKKPKAKKIKKKVKEEPAEEKEKTEKEPTEAKKEVKKKVKEELAEEKTETKEEEEKLEEAKAE